MSDKKQSAQPKKGSENKIETSFEEMFLKARKLDRFKEYNDLELKEKLVTFLFSMDSTALFEGEETNALLSKEKEDQKEDKYNRLFDELEDHLKEDIQKRQLVNEVKNIILSQKRSSMQQIQKSNYSVYDLGSLHQVLFNLSKEIKAYQNNVFWDYQHIIDRDYKRFRKEIANAFYDNQTGFIGKLWDAISGSKAEKVDHLDPFKKILLFPELKRDKLYGKNVYKARANDDLWIFLLFGTSAVIPEQFSIQNYSQYSLKAIITNLSTVFDHIFQEANVQFLPDKKDTDENEPVVNEGLLFRFVSESFLPVIKIFNTIEYIALSVPFNDNHPMRSIHIAYFIIWCSNKWVSFLEKTIREKKSYVTPQGETGPTSLSIIFDRIKAEINEELVEVNFDEDLEEFYSEFNRREELVKKIDFYVESIQEIKNRFKILISSLIADIIRDYLARNKMSLRYSIDDRGVLRFGDLIKLHHESIFDKIFSIFQAFQKKPTDDGDDGTIAYEAVGKGEEPVSLYKDRVSYSTQKDYSSYTRTLGDLLTIIHALKNSFNENFKPENRFQDRHDNEDKYSYLSSNQYFVSLGDTASMISIHKLQDFFDELNHSIAYGEKTLKVIKEKSEPQNVRKKADRLAEILKQLTLQLKDTSGIIGLVSQNREEYDKYSVLMNKFTFIFNELQKIDKL